MLPQSMGSSLRLSNCLKPSADLFSCLAVGSLSERSPGSLASDGWLATTSVWNSAKGGSLETLGRARHAHSNSLLGIGSLMV